MAAVVTVLLRWVAMTWLVHPLDEQLVWWPLAGLGPVALMLCQRQMWSALIVGIGSGLVVSAALDGFSLDAGAGTVAGVCELVITARLVDRYLPEHRTPGRPVQLLRVLLSALTGILAGSLVYALIASANGEGLGGHWWEFARSHLLGLVIVAAALLAPRAGQRGPVRAGLREHRINLEWAVQLGVVSALAGSTFLTHQRYVTSSVLALPMIWSCLRLGPVRTAVGQVVVSAVMIVGTNHGLGRVAALDRPEHVVLALQDAILNLALITLVVAVVAEVRDRAFAVVRDRTRDLNVAEQMAGLGSSRWVPGGGDVVWSEGMHTLLGTSPQSTTPSSAAFLMTIHEQDRARVLEVMVRAGADGQRRRDEYRIVRPDGGVRDVQSYIAAETGSDGRVRQVFGTLQDITEAKAAAAEVSRAHNDLAAVLDAVTGAAVIGANPDSQVINLFNRGAENLFGYRAQEVVGRCRVTDLHDADHLAQLAAAGVTLKDEVARSLSSQGVVGRQWRFRRKDGSCFPGQLTVSQKVGEDGEPGALIGVVADLTEVLRVQEELSESQDRFRLAFDGAPVGMAMIGLDPADPARILQVNEAFCELTGRTEQELLTLAIEALLIDDGEAEESRRNVADLLTGRRETVTTERRVVRADGKEQWGRVSTSAVRPQGQDRSPYLICLVEDITASRMLHEQLQHEATHDPLTGLPNRLHLNRQLDQALTGLRSTGSVAVLYLDLDGFKAVNDSQGHGAGDELLIQVADRIAASVRRTDVVARLGGDEFAVLCAGVSDEAIALRIAEAILAELMQEFDLDGVRARIGVSIGVALGAAGVAGPALLHEADQAMYAAKRAGKGTIRVASHRAR